MISIDKVIDILQRNGLLCKSEHEVCSMSERGHGCNCGKVYKDLRGEQ
jgi:hypothetical protein